MNKRQTKPYLFLMLFHSKPDIWPFSFSLFLLLRCPIWTSPVPTHFMPAFPIPWGVLSGSTATYEYVSAELIPQLIGHSSYTSQTQQPSIKQKRVFLIMQLFASCNILALAALLGASMVSIRPWGLNLSYSFPSKLPSVSSFLRRLATCLF